MIITISGYPGSGKSTVGTLLAKKLQYRFVSMGDLRGEIAMEHGMTIDELNKLGETEDWTDKKTDQKLIASAKQDNTVFDSRTAFYFLPHSLKVFLDVSPDEGAQRILRDPRSDERAGKDREEQQRFLQQRIASDKKRYRTYYGFDFEQKNHYDLWIDTTHRTPGEVVNIILTEVDRRSKWLSRENPLHQ